MLAIKQTLYRTGGDSPIVKALARAAENGKQVTAIVELKARFDEETNIQWARTLEQSGVHVDLRPPRPQDAREGLLVVRREKRRAPPLRPPLDRQLQPARPRGSTPTSACSRRSREIGEDATSLFNLLTGYSAPPKWNSLVVAPLGLHEAVLGLIAREAEHARAGRDRRASSRR